jgi:DNA polymerase I-like protein with 3'-5' exonuclease and polymerase domains
VLSLEEATRWLGVFKWTYREFAQWRAAHHEQCVGAGRVVIGKDAKLGIGRLYPLTRMPQGVKSAYTRCCNLPIQGACADASMQALEAIDQSLFNEGIDGGPVAWLHDEIILEVPEAEAPRANELLERAMIDAFEQTFPGSRELGLLNSLVEVRIGINWAAVKEKPKRS